MADLGRWAGSGQGRSTIPDTYPVLQLTELSHDPRGPLPWAEEVLRDEFVDWSGLGIGTKRFSQDSQDDREIPKQAMARKIKIIRVGLDKSNERFGLLQGQQAGASPF